MQAMRPAQDPPGSGKSGNTVGFKCFWFDETQIIEKHCGFFNKMKPLGQKNI